MIPFLSGVLGGISVSAIPVVGTAVGLAVGPAVALATKVMQNAKENGEQKNPEDGEKHFRERPEVLKIFQRNLSNLRSLSGLTVEKVGEMLDLTRQAVWSLENGKTKLTSTQYIAWHSILQLMSVMEGTDARQRNYLLRALRVFSDDLELYSDEELEKYEKPIEAAKKMKKHFLSVMVERSRYYEKLMHLTPHNIKVRNMTSRYGSNSKKTHSITYAYSLYHYSVNILDAIIVHELAHSIEFNHSKKFYDVVYTYCPNYKALHNMLRKGVYHD